MFQRALRCHLINTFTDCCGIDSERKGTTCQDEEGERPAGDEGRNNKSSQRTQRVDSQNPGRIQSLKKHKREIILSYNGLKKCRNVV